LAACVPLLEVLKSSFSQYRNVVKRTFDNKRDSILTSLYLAED
jgi:hypothetical protein